MYQFPSIILRMCIDLNMRRFWYDEAQPQVRHGLSLFIIDFVFMTRVRVRVVRLLIHRTIFLYRGCTIIIPS